MASIGIRELREHTTDVLRRVRDEGTALDITWHGQVIARIVPAAPTSAQREQAKANVQAMEALIAEFGALNVPPTDSRTIMREERREL